MDETNEIENEENGEETTEEVAEDPNAPPSRAGRVGDLMVGSVVGPDGQAMDIRVGWLYPPGWTVERMLAHIASRAPLPKGCEFVELPEGWDPTYARGRVDQLALTR